ncbi:MAG: stage II sporulation protein P [Lachnospiraceae bacterium]|nr:stage II sporulation protein P [Lachnospiraceae bacterium]
MRRHFRRKRIWFYRILLGMTGILILAVLAKGMLLMASDDTNQTIKKVGNKIMQTLYVKASTMENTCLRYIVTGEGISDNVISYMANSLSMNYYALHIGANTVAMEALQQNKEEQEDRNEQSIFYRYAGESDLQQENKTDAGSMKSEESDLAMLAAKENEEVLIEEENTTQAMLEVEYTEGNVTALPTWNASSEMIEEAMNTANESVAGISVKNLIKSAYDVASMHELDYLINNYYIEDSSTKATLELFNVDRLLEKDMSVKQNKEAPQILIYHTHASETFCDSREGEVDDTVVGAGEYLTELLRKRGYQVYHDTTAYDQIRGRDYSYSTALPYLEEYLSENPSIEVIIDLHRDSGSKRMVEVNGKDTAQIMLFNGLCRNTTGPIESLTNPNLEENLAFSLQMNLVGNTYFPGFMKKIYLKKYRYNMHLAEKYLLIECGTQENTVKEAYNAMEPLAMILDQVLSNP